MGQIFSHNEFSKALGIDGETLRAWRMNGCPTEPNYKGQEILYDLERVVKWIQSKAREGMDENGIPFNANVEAALLNRSRRAKVELEVKLKSGELIDQKETERELYSIVRALRDNLLSIPDQIASAVAAETDESKVYALIVGAVQSSLDGFVAELENKNINVKNPIPSESPTPVENKKISEQKQPDKKNINISKKVKESKNGRKRKTPKATKLF